jgi:predicted nucleotidyltransferase component of viral defense system
VDDAGLANLRRHIIAALATDQQLFELLVLKGGNALSLVHEIGLRASTDIDYSMEGDSDEPEALGAAIFEALHVHLGRIGLIVFDETFRPRPLKQDSRLVRWGGYTAEFKLASREVWEAVGGSIDQLRKRAIAVSDHMQASRKFRIEISKYEYCQEREEKAVEDGLVCQVYTLELIAAEKLRSICQQMTEYGQRAHPAPRARDFYDIHALCTEGGVELSEEGLHEIVAAVFNAKQVPLRLLSLVTNYRDFHEPEWEAVLVTIPAGRQRDYDFYFRFVTEEIRKLEPLWVEDAPG